MSEYRIVRLDKEIKSEKLEQILIRSASELGLNSFSKDRTQEEFELRKGQFSKRQIYGSTEIWLAPEEAKYHLAKLTINRGRKMSSFPIEYDIDISGTLIKDVEKYLIQVAKNLNSK